VQEQHLKTTSLTQVQHSNIGQLYFVHQYHASYINERADTSNTAVINYRQLTGLDS